MRSARVAASAGDDYWLVLDGTAAARPGLALAARGLRGPSRVVDPGALRVDRPRASAPRPLRDAVLYELHVGTFTAEGTFEAAAARLPALAELGRHPRRAHAGRRVPRPPRLGLRRRLPVGRALGLRRPARPCALRRRRPRRGPRRHPRRRLQPRRRQRRQGAGGLRPVLHRAPRDAVGQGGQLRRRGVRRRPRVGAAERDGLGARLPRRRPAPRRDPRHPRRRRPPRAARAGRPRPRRRPPGAGHRRERAERPQGHPPAAPGRLRPRRRVGRRLPPRPARAAHRRALGVVRGVRAGGAAGQGLPPPARPRRRLLDLPRAALRRPRRRPRARAVRGLQPEPRPGRQPRLRRPAAGARAAAGRVLHAAGTLHSHALHGRGTRRARAVSVLLRSHRQAHGRRDPRGPPPGVRRLRRVRRRGGPRPAGPGDLRALQAHAPRQHEAARAVRRAAARAPGAAARRRQHRVLRGRRLAARAPRRLRAGLQLRGGRAHGAGARGARWRWPRTARRWATAACACPRARER